MRRTEIPDEVVAIDINYQSVAIFEIIDIQDILKTVCPNRRNSHLKSCYKS